MLALDGVAAGMTSTPTTFDENSSVPVGNSLQLQGTGTDYTSFTGWGNPTTTPTTMGAPNIGQVFGVGPTCDSSSVTADRLTFSTPLSGCIVPGETFSLTVCATDSTGDVAVIQFQYHPQCGQWSRDIGRRAYPACHRRLRNFPWTQPECCRRLCFGRFRWVLFRQQPGIYFYQL